MAAAPGGWFENMQMLLLMRSMAIIDAFESDAFTLPNTMSEHSPCRTAVNLIIANIPGPVTPVCASILVAANDIFPMPLSIVLMYTFVSAPS